MSPILWSVLGALLTVLAFVLFRRVVRARAGRTVLVTDHAVLASALHLKECRAMEEQAMAYELALWCEMDDDVSLAAVLGSEYAEASEKSTEATHRRMVAQQELDEALVAARVVLV
jgi:hypothetical protein